MTLGGEFAGAHARAPAQIMSKEMDKLVEDLTMDCAAPNKDLRLKNELKSKIRQLQALKPGMEQAVNEAEPVDIFKTLGFAESPLLPAVPVDVPTNNPPLISQPVDWQGMNQGQKQPLSYVKNDDNMEKLELMIKAGRMSLDETFSMMRATGNVEDNGKEPKIVTLPLVTKVRKAGKTYDLFQGRIEIKKLVHVIADDDSVTDYFGIWVLASDLLTTYNFYTPVNGFKTGFLNLLRKKCRKLYVNLDIPNYTSCFEKFASVLDDSSCQKSTLYLCSGWRKVQGIWRFLHNGRTDIGVKGYARLPPLNQKLVHEGQKLLAKLFLAGNDIRLIMIFLYAHLGFMSRLFLEAGFESNFVFYVASETGSRKTALIRILSGDNYTENPENSEDWGLPIITGLGVESSLNDTQFSIEEKIKMLRDFPSHFDDMHPNPTPTMVTNMKVITRSFGDGKKRGKKDQSSWTSSGGKITGAPFITGEFIPDMEKSLKLRIIQVKLEHDLVDTDALTDVQNNMPAIKAYFAYFVGYLENNFQAIVANIKSGMSVERKRWVQILGVDEGRYIDAAVKFSILTKSVFYVVGNIIGRDTNADIQQVDLMLQTFFRTALAEVESCANENTFIDLFKEAFASQRILIAPSPDKYRQDDKWHGYFDTDMVVVNSDFLRDLVDAMAWDRQLNYSVPTSIRQDLIGRGLINPAIKRCSKDRFRSKVVRPAVFAFRKEILE